MSLTKKPRGYDQALQVGDTVTQRLRCINRELEKSDGGDNLSPEIREKVACALHNHLIRCEGLDPLQVLA